MAARSSPFLILARDPLVRRAGLALALYRIAEFGPWVAILVFAYAHGGASAAGLVSFVLLLPTALCAPLAGPVIDRFGASRVLVSGYAVQALVMAATATSLLAGAPPALSYVLAAATATLMTVTHPAHAVVSPGIARTTEQLVALNSITAWILSLGLVVAPAVAGLILELSTPGAVYAAGAACLAAAWVNVFPLRGLVPPLARQAADHLRPRSARALKERAAVFRLGGATGELVLVVAATFVVTGAFDVLAVVLAIAVLGLGASGAGYLTALYGGGAVIGAAASSALVGRSRIVPALLGAALLGGAAFVVLGAFTSVGAAVVLIVVAGVSRSLLEVSAATLLQRVTPTAELALVFATKEGLAMAACGLGAIFVSGLVALGGVRVGLVGIGLIVPIVVLARFRPLLRVEAAATVPVVAIALLRSMPIFRALPVPALEGIAYHLVNVSVPAGTPIVTQGEPGDHYYAIADGRVEVTQDGRRLGTLGRGDGFGEIAVLRDTERTATVTATTDSSLFAIEGNALLVALTGHPESEQRARSIAAERLAAVET